MSPRPRSALPALLWLCLSVALPVLLAMSGGGGAPRAREASPPGFVGSATCAGCHAAEAEAWRGSDHARAMAVATPATVLGDFADAAARSGGEAARFERDAGGSFRMLLDGAPVTVTETFGADPLQQYLATMPDGRRQALPWAWDSRPREAGGQRWFHLMPDAHLRPGDPLHWTGRDQGWNFMCASCHSTGLVRGYDVARDRYDTTWSEIAVGCESCHGRGAAHVAWARAGAATGTPGKGLEVLLRDPAGGWAFPPDDPRGIALWQGPPRIGSAAQLETCAPCHARARPILRDPAPGARFLDTHAPALLEPGLYHADGQMQGEVFEWGSFVQSRMQRAGVACADCHDPHSARLRAEGNAVCAQCHQPARFDSAAHHRHTPGSAGAQCAACHMPAVTYMGVDTRRDHGFRVPRPEVSALVGAPDACTACHADRTQAWAAQAIAGWVGPRTPRPPDPALAIAAGRSGAPGADSALGALATDRTQPAILRATALSLLPARPTNASAGAVGATLRDPEPLVRAAALRALEPLHPRNRLHAVAALTDPVRLVRIEAARALAPVPAQAIPEAARPAFAAAWAELLESERVAAERPEAHVNIAGLLALRGDAAGARAAFAEALRRDPGFLPALVNLANLEEGAGRPEEAERLLRRAAAAHPASPEPPHALGLALARRGQVAAALAPLAEAARLAPDQPRFAYAEALALNGLGRREEAIAALRAALGRAPRDRDTLVALAAMLRDGGQYAEALTSAEAAAALDPADREAGALAAQLRGLRQQRPAASR